MTKANCWTNATLATNPISQHRLAPIMTPKPQTLGCGTMLASAARFSLDQLVDEVQEELGVLDPLDARWFVQIVFAWLRHLAPEERAAYILREAFETSYEDIAALLGKSPEASRQIVSRAAKRIKAAGPRLIRTPNLTLSYPFSTEQAPRLTPSKKASQGDT